MSEAAFHFVTIPNTMFFLSGIIATIMLLLLPTTSFYGNRKFTTLFMVFYSLLYFSIIQYGLRLHSSLELHLFWRTIFNDGR
jgi:hypothetical protein